MSQEPDSPSPGSSGSGGSSATNSTTEKAPTKWYNKGWARFLFTAVFMAVAVYVVAKSVNPGEIEDALKKTNPWWLIACFFAAMPAWLGAAIPVVVFSPPDKNVSVQGVTLAQVAASFVGVAAPAGLGPIALTIRYLTKNGLTTAQALAANILTQLVQFMVSLVVVVGAIIVTGLNPDLHVPWRTVGLVLLGLLAALMLVVLVKRWRDWLISSSESLWDRIYPEAVWALKHPKKLSVALGASILQTVADVSSFLFAILAFGAEVNWWKAAATYLIFKTIGGMMPSPGGIGTVEASLAAGLAMVGVPTAQGVTIAVGYRIATFYAPIILGYIAFRYMERKKMI